MVNELKKIRPFVNKKCVLANKKDSVSTAFVFIYFLSFSLKAFKLLIRNLTSFHA